MLKTVLFRFFRGSGLKGMSGIPYRRAFGETDSGEIFRPFLELKKQSLKEIAQVESLQWIEDETNQSDIYDRNFIRRRIVPLITARWPNIDTSMKKTLSIMNHANELLTDYALELIQQAGQREEAFGVSLSMGFLADLERRKRDLVIRQMLLSRDNRALNHTELEQINTQFFHSDLSSMPTVEVESFSLRRFNSRLYFLKDLPKKDCLKPSIVWDGSVPLMIKSSDQNLGVLSVDRCLGNSATQKGFTIRFREGGERISFKSKQHSQSLKKWLQEKQVEPWLRPLIPLIYLEDQIVAVASLSLSPEYTFHWHWCDHEKTDLF